MSSTTLKFMLSGLVIAVVLSLPVVSAEYNLYWSIERSPLIWLSNGMFYMRTFFHELGHSGFAWFYGYPSIPIFDFNHGGGLAVTLPRFIWLNGLWYLFALMGIVHFRGEKYVQGLIGAIVFFHLITAYNGSHWVFINFMGHGVELAMAAFFLHRALHDLAPRGATERLLNAVLGFGFIFGNMTMSWGLMTSPSYRLVYYQQKGTLGFGDFDKIAEAVSFVNVQGVAGVHFFLCLACLFTPIGLYINTILKPSVV